MQEHPEVTAIWGPNPTCERGYACALNATVDGTKIAYGSDKNVVVRDTLETSQCTVVTAHRTNVKVVKFSYDDGKQQLISADESGQTTMFKMKGSVLEEVKKMQGIGGRVFDIAWYPSDKGLACVGDAKGKNGRVFAVSGTDQGNISGSKRLTSVDIFFYDDNKKNLKDAQLVTSGDDLKVKFYNYSGGFSVRGECSPTKFKVSGNMVRFSPDGKYVAAVGNKQIFVLDCENNYEKLVSLNGDKKKGEHDKNIFAVAWNTEGDVFLTASSDKTVKAWGFDGKTLTLKSTVDFAKTSDFGPAQADFQVGCCYIGDGSTDKWATLSLSGDINIVVLKGDTLEVETRIIAPTGAVTGLDVNQDDGTIAVGTNQGEVLLYDKAGSAQRIKGMKNPKKCIGVAHLGDSIFSTGWDDVLSNTSAENMKLSNRKVSLGGQPISMRRAAMSKTLVTVATKTEVFIVDKAKPNVAQAKLRAGDSEISAAALNHTGTMLAVGFANKIVKLYNVDGAKITEAGVETTAFEKDINVLAFNNDGTMFAAGLKNKYVMLCTVKGEILSDWVKHTASVNDLDFSPCGKWLLSAGSEGDIGIWDLNKTKSFKPKKYFKKAHITGVIQAKWLDDSTFYTAGSFDGSIKRWNVTL